jgi:hypothetical protein
VKGIIYPHDSRSCWDCGGQGVASGATSRKIVDATLHMIGWRFLETGGRMVCPECAEKRRRDVTGNQRD